jgi:acyl-CoA dehydrogenase
MAFALTEEQRLLVETAREIVEGFGEAYFREHRLDEEEPEEYLEELSAAGFFGIPLPVEYGGQGMGMFELSLAIETLGQVGAWEHLSRFTTNTVFGGLTLANYGTDDQKERHLPSIAAGEEVWALGVTESGAGSNMLRTQTSAERDGEEFVLNGEKAFNSGLDIAEKYVVLARTKHFDNVERRTDGLTLFLVDPDAPGIEYEPVDLDVFWPAGHRTFTVHIDDLRVHESQVVGEVHEGIGPIFDVLNPERISTASEHIARGKRVLDRAVEYANEREVWGEPIGAHQGVQHPLAESHADLETADLMLKHAARRTDAGAEDAAELTNLAHLQCADAAFQAADNAVETYGGTSAVADYGIAAVWSLLRHQKIAPVTRNMKLNYIANNVLDLPRSYGV